jgi:hypothetical protein
MLRSLLIRCLAIGLLFATRANAQTTNQGTDFYLGFMDIFGADPLQPSLLITGNTATTGTVEIPGLSFSATFTVTPGARTIVELPSETASLDIGVAFPTEVLDSKGVHVTAGSPITVQGFGYANGPRDGYLGLPTPALGTDHIILGFSGGEFSNPDQFKLVATQDGTRVTITPSITVREHPAGVPYTISLNRLQTYQLLTVFGTEDLRVP